MKTNGSFVATPLQASPGRCEVSETNFLSDGLGADKSEKPALQVDQGGWQAQSSTSKRTSVSFCLPAQKKKKKRKTRAIVMSLVLACGFVFVY